MKRLGVLMKEPENKGCLPDDFAWHAFLVRYPTLLTSELFAFTLGGIDYHRRVIHGYRYNKTLKEWSKTKIYQLPEVIINRSYTSDLTRNSLWKFREGKIFNSHLWLPKSKVYKTILKHPVLKNHLPYTVFNASTQKLAQVLKKHPSIYLKPILRAQGRGIFQVFSTSPSTFAITFMEDRKIYRSVNHDIVSLTTELKRCLYKDEYLIQCDANLANLRGRRFDFRIFAIKQPNEEWFVPGSYGRWARKYAVVTNQSQGAETVDTHWLLEQCFGKRAKRIYAEIVKLAVLVSEVLAKQYEHMAILGHDFGVDGDGKVWFIEANAYPGFPEQTATFEVVKAIYDYANSL